MKQKLFLSTTVVIVLASMGFLMASNAYAATPTLSLSSIGGDSVLVNVFGDSNASVMLYYNVGSASGMQVTTLGSTNANGSFSTTINGSAYSINSGSSAYVIVNNQQSPMQTWPITTATAGAPSLSQNNVTLGLGQSITITSQANTNSVYMATNSVSTVATIQTNGAQIIVTGIQPGATTATICYTGTATNCASLNITVQNGSAQTLSFNQNNVALTIGQSASVIISGGSGIYNVSSNSNTTAITTALTGNTITITGTATGNANITVCDQSSNCGTLYTTVNANTSNASLSFNQTSPSIIIGQVINVTISGGTGYYASSNSNPSIASQNINGNTIAISGLANGNTTITVCSLSNGCGSINVTVGSSNANQSVSFGTTNPTITTGQNAIVSLSGSSNYFISSNSNASAVQATLSGASLTLYGANPGSASITVCGASGGCNILYATVTNASTTTTSSASTASVLLAAIQAMQTQLTQMVIQIQTMATQLTQLIGSVTGGASAGNTATTLPNGYKFLVPLALGSKGTDVTELQKRLTTEGDYTGPINGVYSSLTQIAVKKYQTAHGITPLGNIGPGTRAALNGS